MGERWVIFCADNMAGGRKTNKKFLRRRFFCYFYARKTQPAGKKLDYASRENLNCPMGSAAVQTAHRQKSSPPKRFRCTWSVETSLQSRLAKHEYGCVAIQHDSQHPPGSPDMSNTSVTRALTHTGVLQCCRQQVVQHAQTAPAVLLCQVLS